MGAKTVSINEVDRREVSPTKLARMERAAKAEAEAAYEDREIVLVNIARLSPEAQAEVRAEIERHQREQHQEFLDRLRMKPWQSPVRDVVVTYMDPNTNEMVDSPPVRNFVVGR